MSSASSASSSAGVVPPPAFLLEVCVDSVASARAAERAGASRVELCCALVEGGLTPSIGLIKAVRAAIQIPVMVLIRPRAGDFLYTRDELAVMREDIRQCRAIGRIDGVVFGLLQADGAIDLETTRDLVQLAHPMACTFHRAIDMAADIRQAARDLMTIAGIQRVLTSGGERDTIQGQQTIKELVTLCGDHLVILAGGGLTDANIPSFVSATGVREVHASLRGEWTDGAMVFRKAHVFMGGEKRNDSLAVEYAQKTADEEKIRRVVTGATHQAKSEAD